MKKYLSNSPTLSVKLTVKYLENEDSRAIMLSERSGKKMTTHRLITEAELDFLAKAYKKLINNRTYRSIYKTYQDFVDEFIENELKELKKMGFKQRSN